MYPNNFIYIYIYIYIYNHDDDFVQAIQPYPSGT